MVRRIAMVNWSLALLAAASFLASPARAARVQITSLHSPLAGEVCRLSLGPPNPTASASECSELDALVTRARETVPGGASPVETLDRLNHFFFDEEGFRPSDDLDSPDRLLPGGVVAGKQGHCVGLATVYLILAEELGYPIHAVATPEHVFLRWDDGILRRNIELFEKGRDVPDDEFVREMKIPEESIQRGVFMENLSRNEFLGFLHQNRGVLASRRGDFLESALDYREALKLNPKLAAAYYNRGKDDLEGGRYQSAIRDFTRALRLNSADTWAMHNRGLAWRGLGKMEEAQRDLNQASEMDSAFARPE